MELLAKLTEQLPWRLWQRHLGMFIRYGNIQKYRNAASAIYHYLKSSEIISNKPCFLKIEISRHCTVDCLYCYSKKEQLFYPFDKFKLLIDEVKADAFMVQLYEIGEPLHHERLLDFIRYAHEAGLATVISSSLSVRMPDRFWHELSTIGLDLMIVAIDGITESSYKRYRKSGDFNLVMENFHKLLDAKSRAQSSMSIEWQMVDFPWNSHEQAEARKMSIAAGCDVFRIIPENSGPRIKSQKAHMLRKRNCLWAYVLLLVDAYNNVVPCFKPDCMPGIVGNLAESDFIDIWNGTEIRSIRNPEKIAHREGCMYCTE